MKEVIEYFDKESHMYEGIRWRGNFVSRYDFSVTKEALMPLLNGSDFLIDLGCGPGTWLKEFHRNHKRCVGVDISREMLKLCMKKHLPNVDVVLADCHKLPFRDQVFDTTLSSRVFIYLDLGKALRETNRILKDNGSLVLLVQVERQSLYFKLRERLKKSIKFLEKADYLTAQILLAKVSEHFQIDQTKGAIFHEHVSQHALASRPIALLLFSYLTMLFLLERKFSVSFLKYFYASSIVIKANKFTKTNQENMNCVRSF